MMFQKTTMPFGLWGYMHTMQTMLLSRKGLVIRNGDERVLIPKESVLRFQAELERLLRESDSRVDQRGS
jgi:hypothetical protein